MRDPARVQKFFAELTELWLEYCPDWRFGQLLSNWILAEGRDPFYWEEDKFIKELKEFMEKNCVVDPSWDAVFEDYLEKLKKEKKEKEC